MVHNFGEIRTRTPADPNQPAPEAIMPQAAWEAVLWDAIQGLDPPYTPQTLRQWLQATHPQAWAIGAPPPPPPPHREGKGHKQGESECGEGHSGKGAGKGPR